MSDPRIGIRMDSGTQWPQVSISGRPYTRPATTRNIGGGRFVVIDNYPTVDVDAEIATLTAGQSRRTTEDDDDQRDTEEVSDTA